EALERARSGGGPTLIEAFTYRMGAHTTSDDPTRYRSAAEEDYWRQRDPIDRLAAHLAATGELSDAFAAELAAEADALGERVRTTARAFGRPATTTMFEHVYATPHSVVDAERAWFEGYEASFVGGEHA
ncbi:MAG TPA: thiamine pyrophosphate-dependent enzyme, partial [Cellulomonas sp.]